MAEGEKLIPKHGGYRKLKSFQVAQLVYDVTVRFCDRYIEKRSRTHDQIPPRPLSPPSPLGRSRPPTPRSPPTERSR